VIEEITSADIEQKYDEVKEAVSKDEPTRLGTYFLSLVEFLEKASSTFSGFFNDINQMIMEKEVFRYMFEILEYYKYSDILVSKTFKILSNMLQAKNEEVHFMVRYLLQDTQMLQFMIKHGP